jgi:hypothetical protein
MNDIQKRFLLFLIGCMGARSGLVYLAKTINKEYLKYMGYLALIPAIGFIYIYITKSRQTGAEVMGDKIWWNELRPFHALMYILFALYAINGNPQSWIFLLIDVIIGFISFIIFHYSQGNFSKLFI